MTAEAATLEGVETEQQQPAPNPRDAYIAEIAARVADEREKELMADSAAAEVPPEGAAEVATEQPATEEEPPAKEPEAPTVEAPEPQLITIKVDGEERQVTADKIMDAGLRALQKESTADKRLEEATKLLREVQQRFAPPQEPESAPSPKWDEQLIAYALEHGTEEQKVEAVRQLRERDPVATPEQIVEIAEARVLDKVDFQSAAGWFVEEYKDVISDPYLAQLAALRENQLRASGDQRPRRELYKAIGDELRKWRGGTVEKQSFESKAEKKAAITSPPSASVRKVAPQTPKEPTPSEVIEQMRKARGQA